MIKLRWNVHLSRMKYKLNDEEKGHLFNQYSHNVTYDGYFNDREEEICGTGAKRIRRPIEDIITRMLELGHNLDE